MADPRRWRRRRHPDQGGQALHLTGKAVLGFGLATVVISLIPGTASAQTPASPDGFLGENVAHADCVVAANLVPSEEELHWWTRLVNAINPFGDFVEPPVGSVYFVVRCAFSPTAASYLAADPTRLEGIMISTGYMVGSNRDQAVIRCANETRGGVDWYPLVNGTEASFSCTPDPTWSGSTITTFRDKTDDFACITGVALQFPSFQMRTYAHGVEGGSPSLASTGGLDGGPGGVPPASTFKYPAGYVPGAHTPDSACEAGGWYEGGVVPPDWPAGGDSPWADVEGCNGLTIGSDDIRGDFFAEDDVVPMTLIPVDPERPPAAQDVRIRAAEARPRGEPLRWEATAEWPADPDFDYVVGPDTDQHNWVFLLECSDGTSNQVFYDPSGAGGIRRDGDYGVSADFEACIDASSELGLDPSSWVPGLVDRLQCVAKWAVTPTRPISWHSGRFEAALDDTGVGDVVQVATAPAETLGALDPDSSGPTSVTFGEQTIPLPTVDSSVGDKIRIGFGILIVLWAIRQTIRWWSGATNSKVADQE